MDDKMGVVTVTVVNSAILFSLPFCIAPMELLGSYKGDEAVESEGDLVLLTDPIMGFMVLDGVVVK